MKKPEGYSYNISTEVLQVLQHGKPAEAANLSVSIMRRPEERTLEDFKVIYNAQVRGGEILNTDNGFQKAGTGIEGRRIPKR